MVLVVHHIVWSEEKCCIVIAIVINGSKAILHESICLYLDAYMFFMDINDSIVLLLFDTLKVYIIFFRKRLARRFIIVFSISISPFVLFSHFCSCSPIVSYSLA